MTAKSKALIGLGLTVILFSFVVIATRFAVSDTSQSVLMFYRMLFASLAFLPFVIKSQVWKKAKFRDLLSVSALSSVNILFFMWGIKYTSASASQLIYAAAPILNIVISDFIWKEKVKTRTIVGVIIGLFGIFFVIISSVLEKGETISGSLTGNIAVVIAMLGWLFYTLLSKRISKYFNVWEIGSTSILITLFCATFFLFFQHKTDFWALAISFDTLLICLYLGIFGTFATYVLMQYAIKHLSTLTVNLTSYIQPISTTLLAIILLGEKLTPTFILGGLFVFSGIIITVTIEFYRLRH